MSRIRAGGALPNALQILVVAVVAVVSIALIFLIPLFGNRGKSVAATATPQPLPSGFFQPTDQEWQSLATAPVNVTAFASVAESDGSITAPDDTTTLVFAPFTGRITHVFVTVGDTVRAGQQLFTGEGNEYAQAQNDLSTALATLAAAQTQARVTRVNHARLVKLLASGGAARKDVEQSAADLATAVAAVKNAQIAADLARAHARVLGDDAAKATSSSLPTLATVRAPVAGTITQRAVGAGQYVQSAENGASTPLLTISDLSHVFFTAAVTETQITGIRTGAPVDVRLAAFPDRVFHAEVEFIAPALDPNTHRIAVRARVENPDGLLKPGMFGSFRIATGSTAGHLGVPEDAVIFEGDTARVWVTGPHRSIALHYIKTGKIVDGMVEVLSGLHRGDRVVTSGSVFIDRASQGDD